jgi:predicted nucleotidyltransferase
MEYDMAKLAEIMQPTEEDAERIAWLLKEVDSKQFYDLYVKIVNSINDSRITWVVAVRLLTYLLASIIEQIHPEAKETLAGDIPVLIEIARDEIASEVYRH